jgi:hypothetical protein
MLRSIPDDVLTYLLSEWLETIYELICMDTAICDKEIRKRYLVCLHATPIHIPFRITRSTPTAWFTLREVELTNINWTVRSAFNQNIIGSFPVRQMNRLTLDIQNTSVDLVFILQALSLSYPQLHTLECSIKDCMLSFTDIMTRSCTYPLVTLHLNMITNYFHSKWNDLVGHLSTSCPLLRCIKITRCARLTIDRCAIILRAFPQLEELEIDIYVDNYLRKPLTATLKEFALQPHYPNLKRLVLGYMVASAVRRYYLDCDAQSVRPRLSLLAGEEDMLKYVEKQVVQPLEEDDEEEDVLQLMVSVWYHQSIFRFLAKCTGLTSLTVKSWNLYTSEEVHYLCKEIISKNWKHLTSLTVNTSNWLCNNDVIPTLGITCYHSLQRLSIDQAPITRIEQDLPYDDVFLLLKDAFCAKWSSSKRSYEHSPLKRVELIDVEQLTDRGFAHLFDSSINLQLDNSETFVLAEQLEAFSVIQSKKITMSSYSLITNMIGNLKTLSIQVYHQISIQDIVTAITNSEPLLRRLEELSLVGSPYPTMQSTKEDIESSLVMQWNQPFLALRKLSLEAIAVTTDTFQRMLIACSSGSLGNLVIKFALGSINMNEINFRYVGDHLQTLIVQGRHIDALVTTKHRQTQLAMLKMQCPLIRTVQFNYLV